MKFNAPVYMDEGLVFVPANTFIKQKDIDRLKTWEIVNVYTEGMQITDDSVQMNYPEIIQVNNNSLPQQKICFDIYNNICKKLTVIFNSVAGHHYFDRREFKDIVRQQETKDIFLELSSIVE